MSSERIILLEVRKPAPAPELEPVLSIDFRTLGLMNQKKKPSEIIVQVQEGREKNGIVVGLNLRALP